METHWRDLEKLTLPYPVFDEPLLWYPEVTLEQAEASFGPYHREMDR